MLVALLFRLSDTTREPADTGHQTSLYGGLIMTAVLPLTALLYGTSVLGDELEDGTAIYLLTKPIPRWQILLPKLIAPWLLTSLLVVASTVVSGVIAIDRGGLDSRVWRRDRDAARLARLYDAVRACSALFRLMP